MSALSCPWLEVTGGQRAGSPPYVDEVMAAIPVATRPVGAEQTRVLSRRRGRDIPAVGDDKTRVVAVADGYERAGDCGLADRAGDCDDHHIRDDDNAEHNDYHHDYRIETNARPPGGHLRPRQKDSARLGHPSSTTAATRPGLSPTSSGSPGARQGPSEQA